MSDLVRKHSRNFIAGGLLVAVVVAMIFGAGMPGAGVWVAGLCLVAAAGFGLAAVQAMLLAPRHVPVPVRVTPRRARGRNLPR